MPEELIETLRDAQRLGFFGAAPIEQAVTHALGFVTGLGPLAAGSRLVDLGSGGGLPGLVVAVALPEVEVTLVDRRQKRTDVLERAVRRLGLGRVSVRCVDAELLARAVATGDLPAFDAVTARGFGPPEYTLRLAVTLCPSGPIVISEPPDGDRWPPELLDELRVEGCRVGPVRRFVGSKG